MKLPKLPNTRALQSISKVSFGALNEKSSSRDGQIKNMLDITGAELPFLSVRGCRSRFIPGDTDVKLKGFGFDGGIPYIVTNKDGVSRFYYNGALKGEWADTKGDRKTFCTVGRYIVIYPDAVYYKKEDTAGIEEYKKTYDCETAYECDVCYVAKNDNGEYLIDTSTGSGLRASLPIGDEESVRYGDAFQNQVNTAAGDEEIFGKVFFPGDVINLYSEFDGVIQPKRSGLAFDYPLTVTAVKPSEGTFYENFETDITMICERDTTVYHFNRVKRGIPKGYLEEFGAVSSSFEVKYLADLADNPDEILLVCEYASGIQFTDGWYLFKTEEYFGQGICQSGVCQITPCVFGCPLALSVRSLGVYKRDGRLEFCVCVNKSDFPGIDDNVYLSERILLSDVTNTAVYVANKVPSLDMACSRDGRIFGICQNTLYSCAIGDIFSWYRYEGLASDSYALEIPGKGQFTAIVPYDSTICLFKNDRVIKLYGSLPSEFTTREVLLDGVKQGCASTVCVINGTLYYVGDRGVFIYTGHLPTLISDVLGAKFKDNMCAARDGESYYLDCENALYVYDTVLCGWYKQKSIDFTGYAFDGTDVYFLSDCCITASNEKAMLQGFDQDSELSIYKVCEQNTGGSIEFGDFYLDTFNKKRVSRILLRIEAEDGCEIDVSVSYDGKDFERAYSGNFGKMRGVRTIPITPQRCDRFALKITGSTFFRLEGISICLRV